MTHFGIICPEGAGHLNPMIALGREIQKRDHRVTLVGILDTQHQVRAAGLGFQVIGETEFPLGISSQLVKRKGELSGLAALQHNIKVAKQDVIVCLRDLPEAIQSAGIEVLLVDQASVAGGTVAEFLKIPFVNVCNALLYNFDYSIPPVFTLWEYKQKRWAYLRNRAGYSLLTVFAQPLKKLVAEYRLQWGLPLHSNSSDLFSKLAQVSQQPPEFEFPRTTLPPYFHFTGPYVDPAGREHVDFPFDKLTEQPLIYASLGTIQNQLIWIFQSIAEACLNLEAQLVISLGSSASVSTLPKLPGSPLVVKYAPQLDLLKKAALTITHAGLNTTLESLSNGVPLVAIPIATDQPGVAARIAWTGTGEVVTLKQLTVPRLRAAICKVLDDESYRYNARKLQLAIAASGGVSRAADIIEEVARTRKPVYR